MSIQKGDIIKLSFTGRLEDGSVFDTTDEGVAKESGIYEENKLYIPMTIVVGTGSLVEGFEQDMIGKDAGYKGKVAVPPEKGFGLRSIDLIETVPEKKFMEKVHPGMTVEFDGRVGVIESVVGGRVRIDYNDPLAGKTLIYEYSIDEKIEDRDMKIAEILKGYVSQDVRYNVEDDVVSVEVPKGLIMDETWLMGKAIISRFLIRFAGIRKIVFKETFDASDFETESQ